MPYIARVHNQFGAKVAIQPHVIAKIARAYAAATGGAPNVDPTSCKTANPGGSSQGWYTEGGNTANSGAGYIGHHHCDWKSPCCFCTDVPKCIKNNVPPFAAGQCRPDWGTQAYLGQPQYPATADFSPCPAGTLPTDVGTTATTPATTDTGTGGSNILATLKQNWIIVVGVLLVLILLMRR